MKKTFFFIIFLMTSTVLLSQHACKYVHYKGSIYEDVELQADMTFMNGDITGYYTYAFERPWDSIHRMSVTGARAEVQGYEKGQEVVFYEWAEGDTGAVFRGQVTAQGHLSGTYRPAGRKGESRFEMQPTYPSGTLPFRAYCLEEEKILSAAPGSPKAAVSLTLLVPGSETSQELQDYLTGIILEEYAPGMEDEDPETILEKIRQTFFRQYVNANTDIWQEGHSFNWIKERHASIYFNRDHILTFRIYNYAFTGGAHGLASLEYLILDTRGKRELDTTSLFIPGFGDKITPLIMEKLRDKYGLDHTTPLTSAGFFSDTVRPNNNLFINEMGLGFHYNHYEIAPYAMGMIEVHFSLPELKGLLRKDAVLMGQ
ncbi:MAG: DUF3298 domain-containing protein [Bacteroidales bacterium]